MPHILVATDGRDGRLGEIRFRERVAPTELVDVISLTLGMTPRCRSSGVATLCAIVSGLAPGMFALTEITGRSICGSDATGSTKKPAMPTSATPAVSNTVPIGRRTKGRDKFMRRYPSPASLTLGSLSPHGGERVGVRGSHARLG